MARNSQNMYYTRESTARQLQPQEVYVPQRPPARRTRPEPKFIVDVQAKIRHNFLGYVVIIAFFGSVIGVLALNARLNSGLVQLEASNAQLATLEASNAARRSQIYANLNSTDQLNQIYIYATQQLGMGPPEDFQRISIQVARQPILPEIPQELPTQNSFSFSRFWDALTSIFTRS